MSSLEKKALTMNGPLGSAIAAEENLVIDVQFLLQEMMDDKGITRAELARRAGISKARLTQMMRPDANPTLRTLAAIFHALGERVTVQPVRDDEQKVSSGSSASADTWTDSSNQAAPAAAATRVGSKLGSVIEFYRRRANEVGFAYCNDDVGGSGLSVDQVA